MRLDLHLHSTASVDGFSSPSMIVRFAMARGLSGVAVTDHNNISGVEAVRRAAPEGFIVIPGVEYSTDHGHILALFCNEMAEDAARDSRGRFLFKDLIPFVKERNGLLIAAHPYRYKMYLSPKHPFGLSPFLLDNVDGLESINSRDLSRDQNAWEQVQQAAQARGLFITGGSDGHFPMEIGGGYTEFPEGIGKTPEELRTALLEKKGIPKGRPCRKIYRVFSKIWRKMS